ncbi:Alpha/Beta hydrolase protein [Globomyces pollinis-pini]|nr:Alpha/Beta hydrolase protein [Globomyces pollinis-pini]
MLGFCNRYLGLKVPFLPSHSRYFHLSDPVKLYFPKNEISIKYRSPVTKKIKSMPISEMMAISNPSLTRKSRNVFHPHPMLTSGHTQTFWAALVGDHMNPQRVKYEREIVKAPDGGIISLDWTTLPKRASLKPTPLIFILHGLTGGSHESYIQDMVLSLKKYGYECVVMNFRGCCGTEVMSPQLYCGAYTGDVQLCVNHIKKRDPQAVLFGIGFSLGSNVITKYTGQLGYNCPFVGLVSVGNPFDFLGANRAMHRTYIGRLIYSKRMGANLLRMFAKHLHIFKDAEWLDLDELNNAKNIVEFDAAATSKSFGYKTVDEYYRFGSCAYDIPYIQIPTLFLNSMDDPVCSSFVIPYNEIKSNPHTVLATTEFGGHLGWFQDGWDNLVPAKRWFSGPVAEFVNTIMEAHLSLPVSETKREFKVDAGGTPWMSMRSQTDSIRKELISLRKEVRFLEESKQINRSMSNLIEKFYGVNADSPVESDKDSAISLQSVKVVSSEVEMVSIPQITISTGTQAELDLTNKSVQSETQTNSTSTSPIKGINPIASPSKQVGKPLRLEELSIRGLVKYLFAFFRKNQFAFLMFLFGYISRKQLS